MGQQEHALQNFTGGRKETPKPQREKKERHKLPERGMKNLMGNHMEEISYIPREPYSMRLPNVTKENANHLDLTSYMHLLLSGQENKACGKCGEQGHVKRQCRGNVTCKFCNMKSHSTRACRTYANFIREHPLMSSKRNTPEKFHNEWTVDQEMARRVEIKLRKWQNEMDPKDPHQRKHYLPVVGQDVRVQIGEQIHTEVHHPQQREERNYLTRLMVGSEESNTPERRLSSPISRSNPQMQSAFDPQRFQPTVKANNRLINGKTRTYEEQDRHAHKYPADDSRHMREQAIIEKNCFIGENTRVTKENVQYYENGETLLRAMGYPGRDPGEVENSKINRNITAPRQVQYQWGPTLRATSQVQGEDGLNLIPMNTAAPMR